MNSALNYVRGIDLSGSKVTDIGSSLKDISKFKNVQWLKLDRTALEVIPSELTRLDKLEHLSVEGNRLFHVPASVGMLYSLQVFRAPNNDLAEGDLPRGLFFLNDLTTIDLHNNKLKALPESIDRIAGLVVLDVADNRLDSDARDYPIPEGFFVSCTELRHLNLANNRLRRLPPQIAAAVQLQTLILSGNPLGDCPLRTVLQLTALDSLDLSNTGRSVSGLPDELARALASLRSLNLAKNKLECVPLGVAGLPALERLDLGDNAIATLPDSMTGCSRLQVLVLSRNRIESIPEWFLQAMPQLRRLYVNRNRLLSIPARIGRLLQLEQLFLARNNLTELPQELFTGCRNLVLLKVTDNQLRTLPDAVHGLKALEVCTDGNVDFSFPSKPQPPLLPSTESYYADFSREAGAPAARRSVRDVLGLCATPTRSFTPLKKAAQSDNAASRAILDGLVKLPDLSKTDDNASRADLEAGLAAAVGGHSGFGASAPARESWVGDFLSRDDVDHRGTFGESVGSEPGFTVWRIENFSPAPFKMESTGGSLLSGDCFIFLSTEDPRDGALSLGLTHTIFFWIGKHATLDKKASAAMNASALRGLVKCRQASRREEQGDESEEFLELFDGGLRIVDGGTDTGFFTAVEEEYIDRLYVLANRSPEGVDAGSTAHDALVRRCNVHLEAHAIPVTEAAFQQSRHALLFISGENVFLWRGADCSHTHYNRARLFAVKFIRGPQAEGKRDLKLVEVGQGDQNNDQLFDKTFQKGVTAAREAYGEVKTVSWSRGGCKVYEVRLGQGYIEIPQIARPGRGCGRRLSKECLNSRGAYIVDDGADIFVWCGRQSSRIVQAAATRLVVEIQRMVPRPPHQLVTYQLEGLESAIFKSKFLRWDDVLPVDHRSSEVKLLEDARRTPGMCPFHLDVSDLFAPRHDVISDATAMGLEEEWKADLDKVDVYIYVAEKRGFTRLPKEHVGTFHSENCYLYLCREFHMIKTDDEGSDSNSATATSDPDDFDAEIEEMSAFFWQGRDAGLMPWLVFTLQFLPLLSEKVDCNVRVVRENQFRETMRFMALFDRKMIVMQGNCHDTQSQAEPQLFEVHAWRPLAYTRTIQVECTSKVFHPTGCFLLRVPLGETAGAIYVWHGSHTDRAAVAAAAALPTSSMWPEHSVQEIGPDDPLPQVFCRALGLEPSESGTTPTAKEKRKSSCLLPLCGATRRVADDDLRESELDFDAGHPGVATTRLFKCAFHDIVFRVREKVPQVCQDDLEEDGVAIVTAAASPVWIWIGPLASDVLVRLAKAAANELARRCGLEQKVVTVLCGQEPVQFTRLFHGWARSILRSIELKRTIPMLKNVLDPLPAQPPLHRRYGIRSPFFLHRHVGPSTPVQKGGESDAQRVHDTAPKAAPVVAAAAAPAAISPKPFSSAQSSPHSGSPYQRNGASPRYSTPTSSRKTRLRSVSSDRSNLRDSVGSVLDDDDALPSSKYWV
mmetsp:Transcript_31254/g.93807  ORF Transcript_31254/g.93807 Transcript_31254/m.93807 type:complete len:1472 (-) Transcript_31254:63-4478(-)